jgi:hypothetical protein
MAYAINRTQDFFRSELKFQTFNHNLIGVVNKSGGYSFFSPGDSYLPFKQVPWYVEGTKAFLIGGKNHEFYTVPFSTANANLTRRIVWIKIDNHFNVKGAVYQTYTGHQARPFLLSPENLSEKQWSNELKDELGNIFPTFTVTSSKISSQQVSSPNMSVFSKVHFSNNINRMGQRFIIRPADLMLKTENPFLADKREHPIIFDYAYDLIDVLHIELPRDWHIEALPQQLNFSNDVGKCVMNFVITDNMLSVQHLFRLNNPFWPASQYEKVQELFKVQQKLSQYIAVLNIGDKKNLTLMD